LSLDTQLTDANSGTVTIEDYVDKLPLKYTGLIKWDTGNPPSNRHQNGGAGQL